MSEKIFKGRVVAVLQKKEGVSKQGNSWVSQEYVVEEAEGMYPKKMCFNVFGQDKIDAFAIKNGDLINVYYDIDAKEWQGRWFNSINAWKVEHEEALIEKPSDNNVAAPKQANDNPLPPINPQPVQSSDDGTDDLPF